MPLFTLALSTAVGGYAIRRYSSGGHNQHWPNQTGRHVIIIGGHESVGKETAVELARLGATVTLGSPDTEETRGAVADIQDRSGSHLVYASHIDLGDLASVSSFAQRYLTTGAALHVLIHNATIQAPMERTESPQGLELTLTYNHLSRHLLTRLLLPLLRTSAPSRVLNVTGIAASGTAANMDDLACKDGVYSSKQSYINANLLSLMDAAQLDRSLGQVGVTFYSVYPGVVRGKVGDEYLPDNPKMTLVKDWVVSGPARLLAKSDLEAAQTALYCTLAPLTDLTGGGHYADCRLSNPGSQQAVSKEEQKHAWAVTEHLLRDWTKDLEEV